MVARFGALAKRPSISDGTNPMVTQRWCVDCHRRGQSSRRTACAGNHQGVREDDEGKNEATRAERVQFRWKKLVATLLSSPLGCHDASVEVEGWSPSP